MEDNLNATDTFAPSVFEQAAAIHREKIKSGEGFSTANSGLFPIEPSTPAVEIDEGTSQILVQVPFDIASYLVKSNAIKLDENETIKLGKLWRGPLQRLLGKYEDSDIAIAAIAMLGIAGEKYFEYQLQLDHNRNNSGNAREGKDELREGTPV